MQKTQAKQTKLEYLAIFGGLELKHAVRSDHVYAKHLHEEYSFCLMHRGVAAIEHRGQHLLSGELSLSIMHPAEVHACYTADDSPMSYSMLYPSVNNFNLAYEDLFAKDKLPYFKQTVIQDKDLSAAFQRFLNQSMLLAKETFYIDVLSLLFRRYSDSNVQRSAIGKEHTAVSQIKAYMQANYQENISLKQLSLLTQLNQSYLSRVFRNEVGLAPHAYLNNLRLLRAKTCLLKQPIADVAFDLGFADQSHFTRLFKRAFGITSKQYQKGKNIQDLTQSKLS